MPLKQDPDPSTPDTTIIDRRSFSQEGQGKPMPKNAVLRHYAWVIRDRSMLILFFFIVCSSSTYIISSYLPPVYQATTIIKIGASTASNTAQVQTLVDNAPTLVTSPAVLKVAAQKLQPSVTVSQLQQMTNSSIASQSQLLIIQSHASSAQQAVTIANRVAQSYMQVQRAKETTSLQTLSQTLMQQLKSTRQNLDNAQLKLDTLKAEASSTQNISQQQSLLDINQSSYNQLLMTYSQVQLQKAQVADLLLVIQPATSTTQPSSPDIWRNTIEAAGSSLLLLCVLALLADWWDNSLKTADDIVTSSGLEPLSQIPLLRALHNNAQLLDFAELKMDAIRDAVAVMGIHFQVRYKGQRTLLCTSLHKQAGTTLTASQLATTLAHSGMRVLLIDAQLKRPTLHTIFNLPNTYGLTNSINDFMAQPISYTADWLAQWKTYVPNLWLLPSGPVHERYQTEIATPHLIQLKERLLEQPSPNVYATLPQLIDIMIFDAPPLEEGSLTQRLTAIADASILVVKSRQDRPEQLIKARNILQRLETPILGVIVNRYKARYRSYFYHAQAQYSATDIPPKAMTKEGIPQSLSPLGTEISTHQAIPDASASHISFYQELPETPQPWQSNELLVQAIQPRLSLPAAHSEQTQRFNSLLHPAISLPKQSEAREKLTLPLPIITAEHQALTSVESLDDQITSLKLPKVEKPSLHHPELPTQERNTYQFKSPYEQEEYHRSREQLT